MADLTNLQAQIMAEYGTVVGWAKINTGKSLAAAVFVGWALAHFI